MTVPFERPKDEGPILLDGPAGGASKLVECESRSLLQEPVGRIQRRAAKILEQAPVPGIGPRFRGYVYVAAQLLTVFGGSHSLGGFDLLNGFHAENVDHIAIVLQPRAGILRV